LEEARITEENYNWWVMMTFRDYVITENFIMSALQLVTRKDKKYDMNTNTNVLSYRKLTGSEVTLIISIP
jgi:hypothetical protein